MPASRYQIHEAPGEIRITGEDRDPVSLAFRARHVDVVWKDQLAGSFPFFHYRNLIECVCDRLMASWEPPQDRPASKWPRLRDWAVGRTALALSSRIHPLWRAQLEHVDQCAVAVQRSLFAAAFKAKFPRIVFAPELYREQHLVQDIVKYRAAAIALADSNYLCHQAMEKRVRRFAKELGADARVQIGSLENSILLNHLQEWRVLFSDQPSSYPTLDRSLMNLPGRIPIRLLRNLTEVHLERPISNRLELLATLAGRDSNANWRVFHHAPEDRIRRAIALVGHHTRQTFSLRRASEVSMALKFIADFPDRHNGNLVGLAEKSIEWHRAERRGEIARTSHGLEDADPTAPPPIDPPEDSRIRLLRTVGEVSEEGKFMEHCLLIMLRTPSKATATCFTSNMRAPGRLSKSIDSARSSSAGDRRTPKPKQCDGGGVS